MSRLNKLSENKIKPGQELIVSDTTLPSTETVTETPKEEDEPSAEVAATVIDKDLDKDVKRKIGLFTNVPPNMVLEGRDANSIYEVPLLLEKEEMAEKVIKKLRIRCGDPVLEKWSDFVHKIYNPSGEITIGICGKYTELHDAYKSISESFVHSGVENDVKVNVQWINGWRMQN